MNNPITTIVPIDCPHCKKQLLAGLINNAPQLAAVTSVEEVESSKKKAIDGITKLNLPPEATEDVLAWLNQGETLILPADVETIVNEVKKTHGSNEIIEA